MKKDSETAFTLWVSVLLLVYDACFDVRFSKIRTDTIVVELILKILIGLPVFIFTGDLLYSASNQKISLQFIGIKR